MKSRLSFAGGIFVRVTHTQTHTTLNANMNIGPTVLVACSGSRCYQRAENVCDALCLNTHRRANTYYVIGRFVADKPV